MADPTPDVTFTVATASVGLLETFRTADADEPWWDLPNPGPFCRGPCRRGAPGPGWNARGCSTGSPEWYDGARLV